MPLSTSQSTVSRVVGKVILFLVVAGLVSGFEHLILVWFYPTASAELGLRQFEPRNSVAEVLRSHEFAKNVGMTIRIAAIALFGLALFGGQAGNALSRLASKGDQQ